MNESDLLFDRHHIWHPYTSMIDPLPCYGVKCASGARFMLQDGSQLIDGMSSWWAAIHGYNHPMLNRAATDQIGSMSHIMFGGLTHEPAIKLCRQLITLAPSDLDCIFLADSGSVAIEVALKMARQYWQAKGQSRYRFVALQHAYHGDTLGAMSVCDPLNSMHKLYHSVLPVHYFAKAPQCGFYDNWLPDDITSLSTIVEQYHHEIAALVIEPIVQGAGGMRIYHPEYLRQARQICNEYDILLIADEIATGFGRTGKLFACEYADITPDILCLGKALTGGYLSLSATLTNRHIANTISRGEAGCFMHGPTFMANPLACAIAHANLSLLVLGDWKTAVKQIESQLQLALFSLKDHPNVLEIRVLGAIGVIETKHRIDVAKAQAFFVKSGVWIRPFGRLLYIMPPFIISAEELKIVTTAMANALDEPIFIERYEANHFGQIG